MNKSIISAVLVMLLEAGMLLGCSVPMEQVAWNNGNPSDNGSSQGINAEGTEGFSKETIESMQK